MKLHLGCGNRRFHGYLNIDLDKGDVHSDIRKLSYPNDSVDEIAAIHVVEHFYINEIQGILAEWYRVLKPGGKLVIELPCWDKVRKFIAAGAPDNLTRWPLFGDPRTHADGEPALHKWCWSESEMRTLLEGIGFSVSVQPCKFHVPERDMRMEAIK